MTLLSKWSLTCNLWKQFHGILNKKISWKLAGQIHTMIQPLLLAYKSIICHEEIKILLMSYIYLNFTTLLIW
jgi:hypothetical protein